MQHLFAQLISTTNSRFKYMEGWKGRLGYKIGYSAPFYSLRGDLYTSNVQTVVEVDDTLVLNTLNSIYTFKRITQEEALQL